MLKRMTIQSFTVFDDAELEFGQLNVIHGENGTGKTHLLKLVHTLQRLGREVCLYDPDSPDGWLTDLEWQARTVHELVFGAFAVGESHELVQGGSGPALVQAWSDSGSSVILGVRMNGHLVAENAYSVPMPTKEWLAQSIFIPAQDVFSRDPGWSDLQVRYRLREENLGAEFSNVLRGPVLRNVHPAASTIINELGAAVGGKAGMDPRRGMFIDTPSVGQVFASMAAQGHIKLASLALLLARMDFGHGWSLIWDEPEANLNPRLIKVVAKALVDLAAAGVQVFIATHSLFLLRQLYLLNKLRTKPVTARYFGLHPGPDGVVVQAGDDIAQTGDLVALDEQLAQADLYMDVETGVKTAATEAQP